MILMRCSWFVRHGARTRTALSAAAAHRAPLCEDVRVRIVALVSVIALASCSSDAAPAVRAAPCSAGQLLTTVEAHDEVDLLFAIDSSGSMADEQTSLATALPALLHVLASGDRTGDGPTADDFTPVGSLRVGVITSDVGAGGFSMPGCAAGGLGDDGLLRAVGDTAVAGCASTYPAFLRYVPGVSAQTAEQLTADFACVARVGAEGCSVEQPLEALLKALTPSISPLVFAGGTRGHGDLENAGFLRADSVLGLIVVTDEDDCSVRPGAEGLFDPTSTTFTGDLATRCERYRSAQWAARRYVDGFRALRPGRESLVVFGAIVGVPVDLISAGRPDVEAILADPRMVETFAPSPAPAGATDRVSLEPSCTTAGGGLAFPPRRIAEVAQGFGENGAVESICGPSYMGALNGFIVKIADALAGVCSPYDLERDTAGLVGCDLLVTIPPPGTRDEQPTSCAQIVGAEPTPSRTNADGSIECRVVQRSMSSGVEPTDAGWYYDDFSVQSQVECGPGGRRFVFPWRVIPPYGTRVDFACQIPCATSADCPFGAVCGTTTGAPFCVAASCFEGAL